MLTTRRLLLICLCCVALSSSSTFLDASSLLLQEHATSIAGASSDSHRNSITQRRLGDDDDDDIDEDDDEEEEEEEERSENFEDRAWLVHGSLMALSWGLLAPLAIGSSLLRRLIGKTWFKIHFYAQLLVLALSTIGFGLAIINVQIDDDEHFDETHKTIGLTIFILLIVQVCSGLFRPHAPGHAKVEEDSEVDGSEAAPAPPTKTPARLFFEVQHRILGAGLVLLAWFNCTTGINEVFEENSNVPLIVFWAIVGGIVIVVGLLRLTVQFKKPE